jgi:hypothetical protein
MCETHSSLTRHPGVGVAVVDPVDELIKEISPLTGSNRA